MAVKVYERHLSVEAMTELNTLKKLQELPHIVQLVDKTDRKAKVFLPRNIPKNEYDTLCNWRKGYEILNDRHVLCMEYSKHGDLFDFV